MSQIVTVLTATDLHQRQSLYDELDRDPITDYRLLITSRSQPAKQYKMTTSIPPGIASPDEV